MKTFFVVLALGAGMAWAGSSMSYPGGVFDKSLDGSCWKLDISDTGVVTTSSDTANAPYCR